VRFEGLESRRLLAVAGALDAEFSFDGKTITDHAGQYDEGTAVAVQADNKVVVAALLSDAAGFPYWGVLRYLGAGPDAGELDPSFGTAGTGIVQLPLQGSPRSLLIQADGRIVVGGDSHVGAGTDEFTLLRLTSGGQLDPTFGAVVSGTTRSGFVRTDFGTRDDVIESVALQADGRIVAAGRTQAIGVAGGTDSDFALARYTADGVLDATFSPGGADGDGKLRLDMGGFDAANGVVVQPNGRIVAAGVGTEAGKQTVALARVTTAGVLDGNFDADGRAYVATPAASGAYALAMQADGKLVTLGTPTSNATYAFLSRVNPDGSPAPLNDDGTPTNVLRVLEGAQSIDAGDLVVQADGKLLASAYYYSTTTVPRNGFTLARRNADGSGDPSFNAGEGRVHVGFTNSPSAADRASGANAVAVGPDGRIVAAGFTDAGGGITNVAVARFENNLRAPYRGTPFGVGELIEAEDYDNGGEGVGYRDKERANNGNANYRPREGVDVYANLFGGGAGRLVLAESEEQLNYTVATTAADGSYTLRAKVGGYGDQVVRAFVLVNGEFPAGGVDFSSMSLDGPDGGFAGTVQTFDRPVRLPAGRHMLVVYVSARNYDPQGLPIQGSGVTLDYLQLVPDATPPAVQYAGFGDYPSTRGVYVGFSEDVRASLSAGDLTVRNRETGVVYTPTSVAPNERGDAAEWRFAAPLPDGNYTATLTGAGVADVNGNLLDGNGDGVGGGDHAFDFFHLPGDANRNRRVDFTDLVRLAQNYDQGPMKTWGEGDFTGDGRVDFSDLVLLAQRYDTALPGAPPAAAPSAAVATTTSAKRPTVAARELIQSDGTEAAPNPANAKKPAAFTVRRPARR
jgi:uncharacterized delta-60 repeat protein